MQKSSSEEIRQKIIGLGETSVKKSYYPLLQEKISDLEEKQKQLMEIVRTLEERETELEQLLETKNALLKEVNHRVKNNLQLIGSLLSLSSGETADMFERSQFEKTRKRIETISMIYQEFLFSENYQEVTFCALLRAIAEDVKSESGKSEIELNFNFPVNEIIMDVDFAVSLALITHEVITNSFSYAFDNDKGRLRIAFLPIIDNGHDEKYQLVISDNGPGVPPGEFMAKKESFGITLIKALVYQIGGIYTYENNDHGLSFILSYNLK